MARRVASSTSSTPMAPTTMSRPVSAPARSPSDVPFDHQDEKTGSVWTTTNPQYDGVVDVTVVPGTYDLVYLRYSGSDRDFFNGSAPGDPYPTGHGVLAACFEVTDPGGRPGLTTWADDLG